MHLPLFSIVNRKANKWLGQNDFIRIKRVQLRLDSAVVVRNDNDGDLPPEIYTAEEAKGVNVIGKVTPFKFGRFKL